MIKKIDWVVGIDPDVDKNGVACVECTTKKVYSTALPFCDTIDYLRQLKRGAEVAEKTMRVIIEAGWLNKAHWHLTAKDTKQSAAAKGNAAGRNHETGRKLAEMCKYFDIPYELIKPLSLKSGGVHIWKGREGKITHEEIANFTGVTQRTNQEQRDAILIAWVWAGLPIKMKF